MQEYSASDGLEQKAHFDHFDSSDSFDLCIIGGGINGMGVALDAAGRGLKVLLCEMNDFGSGTSSHSSQLIHGGLRYLQNYAFHQVSKSLRERAILLRRAPHLVQPLSFIIPQKGHTQSWWRMRLGVWLYDRMAQRGRFGFGCATLLDLSNRPEGQGLVHADAQGLRYYDAITHDARLVITNAIAARERGATLLQHTLCVAATPNNQGWRVTLHNKRTHKMQTIQAKVIVNATGPWVSKVADILQCTLQSKLRLVKGSHMIVPRLYNHQSAFLLPTADDRIVFVIPFQKKWTLVGTTEIEYSGDPSEARMSEEEKKYLCEIINHYFKQKITIKEVIGSYAGVRPLYDSGQIQASKITRDFRIEQGVREGAHWVTVIGGKLTTYRQLAEKVLQQLKPIFPRLQPAWTANSPLPGADWQSLDFVEYKARLLRRFTQLPQNLLERLAANYGTRSDYILRSVNTVADLGQRIGADLYSREVDYLMEHEWAQTAEDILWRRTRLGLHLTTPEVALLSSYLESKKSNG